MILALYGPLGAAARSEVYLKAGAKYLQKVVVIGGSGFIGTRLCKRLADRQIPFEIVDTKVSRSFPSETRIADIRYIEQLREAVFGDVIVHLAAVHRDDVTDPEQYHSTNVAGTRNVCTIAREKGIHRIIFTSSVAVYGFAPVGTDERGEITPFNDYGRTKYQAELELERWLAADNKNCLAIIRPTVVFGEGNRGNVYNLLKQIASGRFVMVGPGTNRKSMAYVENVAAFLQHTIEVSERKVVVNYVDDPDLDMNSLVSLVRGRLLNKPGTGLRIPYWLGLAIGHLADMIASISGTKLPVSAIRVKKFCANSSFASAKGNIAGFIPPVTLRQALMQTLEAEFIVPDPEREIFLTE